MVKRESCDNFVVKTSRFLPRHAVLRNLVTSESHSDSFVAVNSLPSESKDLNSDSNWCFEAEFEAQYRLQGGLLCDRPGHGKTATTIGLILTKLEPYYRAWQKLSPLERGQKSKTRFDNLVQLNSDESISTSSSESDAGYFLAPHTTLIVVPERLLDQWFEEFKKFANPNFYNDYLKDRIKVIRQVSDLPFLQVREIQEQIHVLLIPYVVMFSPEYKARFRQVA